MGGRYCSGGGPSRPLARRLSGAAASILPGAVLVLLPKCPLCLAAWLALVTGTGVSAAAVARVRGLVVIFWLAAVALAAARKIRNRAFGFRRPVQSQNDPQCQLNCARAAGAE